MRNTYFMSFVLFQFSGKQYICSWYVGRPTFNEISMSNYYFHMHALQHRIRPMITKNVLLQLSFFGDIWSRPTLGRARRIGLQWPQKTSYERTRDPIRLDVVNTFSVPLLLLFSQNFSCCYKAAAVAATLGTSPILRQQRDWVGGVRKTAIFADVQYYSC